VTLTVGSLFSGIGGLDLGLERAGMEVIWQSEIDPYACKVLAKHWPEVVNHGNIKEINWQEVERPDIICGGYPCQPFSTAGKRRGEEDPRHLWPWVRTAISELRPRYAILENVRGHLSMGGLSVVGELASIGYDAQWRVVSAASVGANHRRDRIIIVAYPQSQYGNVGDNYTGVGVEPESTAELGNSGWSQDLADPSGKRCLDNGLSIFSSEGRLNALGVFGQGSSDVADTDDTGNGTPGCSADGNGQEAEQRWEVLTLTGACRCCADVADADGGRCQQCEPKTQSVQGLGCFGERINYTGWQWWQVEPDVGRVAHGVPRRVDRLRGLGNAVVPQVAEVIGRLVISAEQRREV